MRADRTEREISDKSWTMCSEIITLFDSSSLPRNRDSSEVWTNVSKLFHRPPKLLFCKASVFCLHHLERLNKSLIFLLLFLLWGVVPCCLKLMGLSEYAKLNQTCSVSPFLSHSLLAYYFDYLLPLYAFFTCQTFFLALQSNVLVYVAWSPLSFWVPTWSFACSPCACVGFFHALQLSETR